MQFFAPKHAKNIPYNMKNFQKGPVRIDVGNTCWWFKKLCLAPKDETSNQLHITNRKEQSLYQKWMIHMDPSSKFFRLENLGNKKFLSTSTKQISIHHMSEPFRDNGTPLRLETYDTTSSDD